MFDCQDLREILGVLVDRVEPRLEQLAALACRQRTPLRKRRVCGANRAVRRLGAEVRDLADDLAIRGIAYGQRRPAADPFPADVGSLLEERRIFQQIAKFRLRP